MRGIAGDRCCRHTGTHTWRCTGVPGSCVLRAAGVPGHRDSRRWAGDPNLRASIQAGGCTLTRAGVHLESLLRTGVHVLHRADIQVHHGTK